MKLFNIFVKKNSEEQIIDIVFLREGFSWKAFIFSNLWFLYHKMWREFFALFLINFVFVLFDKIYFESDKILLEVGLLFVVGLNATYWRGLYLQKNNYEFLGTVFGSDDEDAKLRFVGDIGNFDIAEFCKKTKEKKSQIYFSA